MMNHQLWKFDRTPAGFIFTYTSRSHGDTALMIKQQGGELTCAKISENEEFHEKDKWIEQKYSTFEKRLKIENETRAKINSTISSGID